MRITSIVTIIVGSLLAVEQSSSFALLTPTKCAPTRSPTFLQVAGGTPKLSLDEEIKIQWDLFTKHQAKGKWRGTWTTLDYMGDIQDETTASVNLILDDESNSVEHTHDIVMGKIASDCETCYDSEDVRTIPVGKYTPGNMSKYRCASVAMCAGPSLMKSGAMSTELVLTHGNGRVRVVYQHAPVWEEGVEPGSCPPQALKLFRTMVSREMLDADAPPSREMEEKYPPARGNPTFFRGVPPFQWHKKWAGSSWTWGGQTGDRGWAIENLEEADAWHGRPTGDTSDVWAIRMPGGILLQCPRVITTGRAGICRLAWLPEDDAPEGSASDGETASLLRVEASVIALEPVIDEENDVMLGFYPPELGSLRCDVLTKFGELEDVSVMEKLKSMGEMGKNGGGELDPIEEFVASSDADSKKSGSESSSSNQNDGSDDEPLDDSGIDAIRNALKL
eukprot:scaffold592_cov272-Chaetoceros_neogracile.AAC.52